LEPGIESFAGVIIENPASEVLLVRKLEHYAYAIPWCRIVPGHPIQECLREKVLDLTGLAIEPVFLGPSEHIEDGSHLISFDHTARIDSSTHHYVKDNIEYLWAAPWELHTVPMVPLTRQILEQHFLDMGLEPEISVEPRKYKR
jgi:hypothetical protein